MVDNLPKSICIQYKYAPPLPTQAIFKPSRHTTLPPQLPPLTHLLNIKLQQLDNLAGSGAGDVGALGALLAARNADARPLPARAGALAAENVDGSSLGADGALDVVDGQAGDRNAGGGLAGGRAVLVVLLDHDSVLGDLWIVSLVYISFEKRLGDGLRS